jgi:subtilase family serine protease
VLVRTNVTPFKKASRATLPPGYGPSSLISAYNLPSGGSGETVAVVDAYDDPSAQADLNVYRAEYGLPATTLTKVNENGTSSPLPPASGSSGWATEESLDIDMVSAICPQCHIDLVEATTPSFSDLGTAVDSAVTLGAKYVSNSYGAGDFSGESAEDTYYNHPGDVITASAGDSGYGVSYPAASPDVVAVGGTTLTSGGGSRGWTESVWGSSSGGEGTGSGCSGFESKPTWQKDTGCTERTDNDVSAVADPNTGVAVYDSYDQGGWIVVGGTSVSSPVIASVYALAGTPAASTYPADYIYAQHTSNINDVTSGADGTCSPAYLCTAETGYDGPTGWGTPEGTAAFKAPGSAPSGPVKSGISGKCLDDWHSGTANLNKIDIFSCNGTTAQNWTVETNGSLQNVTNGKCVDVLHSGKTNGTTVDLYQCNGTGAQKWAASSGELVNPESGKCLTDPASGPNGTQLVIETCAGGPAQDWTLP